MAVQFPQFPNAGDSLVQGISQGVDLATRFAQLGQIHQQKRTAEWTMGVSKADVGGKYFTDPNLPKALRLKAGNTLIAPFINDKRWGINTGEPIQFTESDLEDENLLKTMDAVKSIRNNKEYSDKEKGLLSMQRMSEYFSQRGDAKTTADIQEKMLNVEKTGVADVNRMIRMQGADGNMYLLDKLTGQATPVALPADQTGQINTADDLFSFSKTNPRDFKNVTAVLDKAKSDLNDDTTLRKAKETLGEITRFKSAISQDNAAFTGLMTSIAAKTIGRETGALNEGDVGRATGDPSAWARVKRVAKKATLGTLTDSDKKDFLELLDVSQKVAQAQFDAGQETYRNQARKRLPARVTDKFINDSLSVIPISPDSSPTPASATPAAGSASPATPAAGALPQSAADWDAFLKAK